MAGKGEAGGDSLRKIILAIEESNKQQTQEMKEFYTRLQQEIIYRMEDITRRMDTIENLMGNKTKTRSERKTAASKTTTTADGADPPQRVPVTWTQYVAYKFETDNDYYEKMMGEDRYKEVAEKAKGLDKLKTEEAKRKKQGTAVANWIKGNETELMEEIKKEHREFKAAASKPAPPVQQKAEADSDTEEAAKE